MHNYMKKILQLQADGKIKAARVQDVDVAHDDWCGIYKGNECNCNPTVTIRPESKQRKTHA